MMLILKELSTISNWWTSDDKFSNANRLAMRAAIRRERKAIVICRVE